MPTPTSERKPAYTPLENKAIHHFFMQQLAKAAWIEEQLENFRILNAADFTQFRLSVLDLPADNRQSLIDLRNIFMLLNEPYQTRRDEVTSILIKKLHLLSQDVGNDNIRSGTSFILVSLLIMHQQMAVYSFLKSISVCMLRTDVAELIRRIEAVNPIRLPDTFNRDEGTESFRC